jgi:dihydroxyacetone kinase-like predicted kinase
VEINTIDAQQLAGMFLAGAKYLEAKKDHINELNVFPVPDGDTGTNMTMTLSLKLVTRSDVLSSSIAIMQHLESNVCAMLLHTIMQNL